MAATALNTPYATLSFPQLFSPKPRSEGSEPVFSCSLLFAPAEQKTAEFKAMQNAVLALAKDKFPNVPVKSLMLPFRDAEEKAYAGYEAGMLYISPWSKYKPGIVDVRLLLRDQHDAGPIEGNPRVSRRHRSHLVAPAIDKGPSLMARWRRRKQGALSKGAPA
jgi:hypothetical protein